MRKKKSIFNPWVSYSDLYSAILLTFILITVFFLLKDMMELQTKAEELEKIAGIKRSIIEELMKAFKDLQVEFIIDNNTGSIILSNDILFAFNDYQLTEKGKEVIKFAIPKYIEIILSPENEKYISSILIEGNTDPIGDYLYNIDLSMKRAFSVSSYLKSIESIIPYKDIFFKKLLCGGKGYNNPILRPDNSIDFQRSRRVEIKFNIKDQEMIDKLWSIFKK